MFKLQHPRDLVARLFILEYMREITADILYIKANKHQKESLFYKFLDDDNNEQVDVNWEYCIFVATVPELENFMKNYIPEIEIVEAKRVEFYRKQREQVIQENINAPVDFNLMDFAKASIEESRGKIIG